MCPGSCPCRPASRVQKSVEKPGVFRLFRKCVPVMLVGVIGACPLGCASVPPGSVPVFFQLISIHFNQSTHSPAFGGGVCPYFFQLISSHFNSFQLISTQSCRGPGTLKKQAFLACRGGGEALAAGGAALAARSGEAGEARSGAGLPPL